MKYGIYKWEFWCVQLNEHFLLKEDAHPYAMTDVKNILVKWVLVRDTVESFIIYEIHTVVITVNFDK